MTSPSWNANPLLTISYSDTSNKVDPIPVTGFTIALTLRSVPVIVLTPNPRLEIPLTCKLEYDRSQTLLGIFFFDN